METETVTLNAEDWDDVVIALKTRAQLLVVSTQSSRASAPDAIWAVNLARHLQAIAIDIDAQRASALASRKAPR